MRFPRIFLCSFTLAVVYFAAPSRAQSPTVPGIIQSWRHAVGTAPRQGTLHQRFTAKEEGVPATVDQWITPSGSLRRSTVREFDSNELLVTPAVAQTRDWNGFIRYLDGTELARQRSQAFIAAVLAFGPPAAMERATLTPPRSPTALRSSSRRPTASASSGSSIMDYLASGSKRSSATKRPSSPQPIAIGDLPAASWHPSTSSSRKKTSPTPTISLPNHCSGDLPAQPLLPDSNQPPPTRHRRRRRASGFRSPHGGQPHHSARRRSTATRSIACFIVDTGDDHESLNAARAAAASVLLELRLRSASYGGGNLVQFSLASGATFTFPGVELHKQHVDLLDQTGLEQALGLPLGGLLGYDFLSRFVVEVDYEAKIMTLHKNPRPGITRAAASSFPSISITAFLISRRRFPYRPKLRFPHTWLWTSAPPTP